MFWWNVRIRLCWQTEHRNETCSFKFTECFKISLFHILYICLTHEINLLITILKIKRSLEIKAMIMKQLFMTSCDMHWKNQNWSGGDQVCLPYAHTVCTCCRQQWNASAIEQTNIDEYLIWSILFSFFFLIFFSFSLLCCFLKLFSLACWKYPIWFCFIW